MFLPLTKEEIKKIANLMLNKVRKNLKARSITLDLTEKALDWMATLGYDPQFGARPMKRVIQNELVNELSKYILSGEIDEGDTINVDANNKGLVFKV